MALLFHKVLRVVKLNELHSCPAVSCCVKIYDIIFPYPYYISSRK